MFLQLLQTISTTYRFDTKLTKMKSYKYLLLLFFTTIFSLTANAQKYQFSGKVFDAEKNPLYYAVVNLKGTAIYDLTDEDGQYILQDIVPGKYTLYVTILGYQPIEKEIEITQDVIDWNFYLEESSLALDEVVVTAKVGQSKEGSTTYKIGSDAIQQVQPISVSDILQLIPGNEVTGSNLNSMAQANLRNAGDYTDLNAFGTAVIVDGNQLSNDGNMQADGNIETANKGIDLREISASNIESVEVISGVPSAKYGNITSGAIIINRKAGYTPYSFSFNSTPNSYQLGVNKGFKLKDGSFLNVDGDYTYSNSSLVSRKTYYQRINSGLRWTKELLKSLSWNNNLSLRYGLGFDGQRRDPDEVVVQGEFENRTHNVSFSTNGSLKVLGTTSYSLSGNYSHQYGYQSSINSGPFIVMESLEEGTYLTDYSPVVFYKTSESFGEPVNINGRIEAQQTFNTFGFRHNTSSGFEFSYDKNFGKGRVLEEGTNVVAAGAGTRDLNFYNVPASEVYSLYVQDDINLDKESANYLFRLGLRYDYMLKRYHLLSPRVSLSVKYFEKLRLRLAYGVSHRTPSMLQLYPGPKYFDLINLDAYAEDDLRRLAVVTTHIYQPTHEDLKPSKGTTLEGGFDWENKGFNLRVTGFYKEIENGITSIGKLMTFDKQVWDTLGIAGTNELIAIPTDSIVKVNKEFSNYENAVRLRTTGVELSAQFPKIKATNTTISLSGSYLKTYEKNERHDLWKSSRALRYGLYERPAYEKYICRSNITIAQHIPQIKLMVTLRTEINWLQKEEIVSYPSPYPIGYYNVDGTFIELSEDEKRSEEYANMERSSDYYKRSIPPTYFNFHIQIRKETKQGHNFSFYANNFLWYNPTYEGLEDSSGRRSIGYLNSRVTFGIGFNFKL